MLASLERDKALSEVHSLIILIISLLHMSSWICTSNTNIEMQFHDEFVSIGDVPSVDSAVGTADGWS